MSDGARTVDREVVELAGVSEYIEVKRNATLSSARKTDVFEIRSKRSCELLGEIRWHGAWRQYTFRPPSVGVTIWNSDCLSYIADTCVALTQRHRDAAGAGR